MNEHNTYLSGEEGPWPLAICLLGNFRLLHAGELIPTRAGGKREVLLAYVALQRGRRVPREQLIQVLWPSSDLSLGLNSLNNLVYTLHKLLGPALHGAPPLVHEDGYYRLNLDAGIGVDVTCFDRLAEIGDQHMQAGDAVAARLAYRRAVELYRGDLCIDVGPQTVVERERLRARHLTLLAQLAEHSYGAADYSACLEHLWQLLARDPYREDAHRLVMRCFVRRGERAAALHQYQVCTDLLRAEFDAPPEPATVALFEQILNQPDHI